MEKTSNTLSPYEIFQQERYGDILKVERPLQMFWSDAERSTAEEAFIFNNENPQ